MQEGELKMFHDIRGLTFMAVLSEKIKELKLVKEPQSVEISDELGGFFTAISKAKTNLTEKIEKEEVKIAGLEELFNSLPHSLEQIKIKNKDNAGTIINIPPSITRFQNLKHLVLVNCINTVPDYICQLDNLNILGVMSNPQLTSLPECLGTMENLEFINFKDTGASAPKCLFVSLKNVTSASFPFKSKTGIPS